MSCGALPGAGGQIAPRIIRIFIMHVSSATDAQYRAWRLARLARMLLGRLLPVIVLMATSVPIILQLTG